MQDGLDSPLQVPHQDLVKCKSQNLNNKTFTLKFFKLTGPFSFHLQVEQNAEHKDYLEDPLCLLEAQRPDGRKDRSHEWLRLE